MLLVKGADQTSAQKQVSLKVLAISNRLANTNDKKNIMNEDFNFSKIELETYKITYNNE